MATPMTLEQFADLTDPRFREIMDGIMDKGEDYIPKFYTVLDSDLETERGSALTPMGPFQQFTGDGQVHYDGPDQGYDWSATHVEWALGTQVQRRLWRFDQFNVVESRWELLGDSAFETKQNHAARIFNEATDVSSLINFTHSRGEALFANTHATTRADVDTSSGFDNLVTGALSRTNLSAMRVQARKFKDDAGRVRGLGLDTLIIPPDLEPTAEELIKSTLQPDTANNAINVNRNRFTILVWDKLDDTNDYILVNMAALKKSLKWFVADDLEYSRVLDFDTYIAKYSGYMQYTSAWTDWRVGIYAQVT